MEAPGRLAADAGIKPRVDDELDVHVLELVADGHVVRRVVREHGRLDDDGLDAGVARALERVGIGVGRDDGDELQLRDLAEEHGVQQTLQFCSLAGNQNSTADHFARLLLPKQPCGRGAVIVLLTVEQLGAAAQLLASAGERDGRIDQVGQVLLVERLELHIVILLDIVEKRRDLRVIGNADERHALSGGKNQSVQPHGHDRRHAREHADDLAGGHLLVDHIIRDAQMLRDEPAGLAVGAEIDAEEHRRQAVFQVGVHSAGGEHGGLFLNTGPLAQHEADILALRIHIMLTQDAVDAAALCGRQRERGVGREDDLRVRDAEIAERLAAVRLAEGDLVDAVVDDARGELPVALINDRADAAAVHLHLAAAAVRHADRAEIIP